MRTVTSPRPARTGAAADFARCAREWARLAAGGSLDSPRGLVGATLPFADGTTSLVFRETVRTGVPTPEPILLVIQFRLAMLGSSPALHAAFRRECILHMPLFAGFPGFRSKLWADDVATGVYRGLYQWDGAEAARHYARRMVGLLAPFSTAGSARSHIVDGLLRDDYLHGSVAGGPEDGWWRLAGPPTGVHEIP
jgi:hypothetical protein